MNSKDKEEAKSILLKLIHERKPTLTDVIEVTKNNNDDVIQEKLDEVTSSDETPTPEVEPCHSTSSLFDTINNVIVTKKPIAQVFNKTNTRKTYNNNNKRTHTTKHKNKNKHTHEKHTHKQTNKRASIHTHKQTSKHTD